MQLHGACGGGGKVVVGPCGQSCPGQAAVYSQAMATAIVLLFCLAVFGLIGAALIWVLSALCHFLAALLPEPSDQQG